MNQDEKVHWISLGIGHLIAQAFYSGVVGWDTDRFIFATLFVTGIGLVWGRLEYGKWPWSKTDDAQADR